jgi:hypothetical protein
LQGEWDEDKPDNNGQNNNGKSKITEEVIEHHQSIKNGKCKDQVEYVAYLTHENSPDFLDLASRPGIRVPDRRDLRDKKDDSALCA